MIVTAPLVALLLACGSGPTASKTSTPEPQAESARETAAAPAARADVVSVTASGEPGAYELAVGVRSPDTGCELYADWWEVLSEDGQLLYRRILNHSHPDEQPFVRSGGPVPVAADTTVWVRAHLAPGGYGGAAMRGSVANGFAAATLEAGFAAELDRASPQPEGCAF